MSVWNYSLYSCNKSCAFCVLSCILPCVGTGINAYKFRKNGILYCLGEILCCYTSIYLRGEIRKSNGIAVFKFNLVIK